MRFLCQFISSLTVSHREKLCLSTMTTVCQQLGCFCEPRPSPELHHIQDFQVTCRNYVMPTYKQNSIDAQNPNHSCPLKLLCLLHDKCRLSRKSLILVLELKSLVLEGHVLVLALSVLVLESLLTSLIVFL